MKSTLAHILPALVFFTGLTQAATVYNIDIGLDNTTSVKSGYTGLISPFTGSGGSVTIDGDVFTLVGQAGARSRSAGGLGNTDLVNRDFAFREAASGGVEIGLQLGGAGALQAGIWELGVYSWDSDVPVIDQRIGIYTTDINGTTEVIYGTAVDKSSTGPAFTFQFTSDGTSQYTMFIRDSLASVAAADADDKVRLNGIDLVFIPEPSSFVLSGLGALVLLRRRR